MAPITGGFNLDSVAIPMSGNLAVSDFGVTGPTPSEGADPELSLSPGEWRLPGLWKEDGAPDWTEEPDGDAIPLYQDGYSIPTGLATVEVTLILAQSDPLVHEITRGKKFDENGYMTVDGGGSSKRYGIFTEEIFKNGLIERKWAPNCTVKTVKLQKGEKGSPRGIEVTWTVNRSALLNNDHYGFWVIPPEGQPAPTIASVNPASAAAGATVTITGANLSGTSQVRFGSTNATGFDNVSPTQVTAVVPAGNTGSAQITVVHPNGNATVAFERTGA
ncbi:IPT/TIG domain-containing protein [Pseudoclavibacter sp. 8L]|uniref:IPT/TIG domain-containing protein n=1 Tax=Pseudoclavibacter sp. 8L TaxID=2653162 RepID=UPI001916C2AB|nr:IPT/TIG domain-containing protein [Pseudoclavibacter sp. 8L]